MKRTRFAIAAVVVAVALLSVGAFFFRKTNDKGTALKAPPSIPYGDA